MQPFIFNGQSNDKDARKQALIAQIMGQGAPAPQTAGQGAAQGLNSVMGGFALRNQKQGAFPVAPGGAKPSFSQGLMNFFGLGGGGLY
jgi:hypothetical protein